jgi:hypothetical protein
MASLGSRTVALHGAEPDTAELELEELDDDEEERLLPDPPAATIELMEAMVTLVAAFRPLVAAAAAVAELTAETSWLVKPGVFMASTRAFCTALMVALDTPGVAMSWAASV